MAVRKRTKITPQWLSLTRKIYTYLTGSVITMTLTHVGWSTDGVGVFMAWWGILGIVIQFGCDVSDENK